VERHLLDMSAKVEATRIELRKAFEELDERYDEIMRMEAKHGRD
jgi:hypothetical protein